VNRAAGLLAVAWLAAPILSAQQPAPASERLRKVQERRKGLEQELLKLRPAYPPKHDAPARCD
jgi:hypothetical protein